MDDRFQDRLQQSHILATMDNKEITNYYKPLVINVIGNSGDGMSGEKADEIHIAKSLFEIGNKVNFIPRDIWKSHVDGIKNDGWHCVEDIKADFTIIAKWHHFNQPKYISEAKKQGGGITIYWTWDYMDWPNVPKWHLYMAKEADYHLTNEGDINSITAMKNNGINYYYFPFDVSHDYNIMEADEQDIDVVFFGSMMSKGKRLEYLKEVNKRYPLTIFSQDYLKWRELGFNAYPAVYGQDFNNIVARSKVVLSMSVTDDSWGYWSNRVGKVLSAGGVLLARWTPGMEIYLGDSVDYFDTVDELIYKIAFLLKRDDLRLMIREQSIFIGKYKFNSKRRMLELLILLQRLLYQKRSRYIKL